ncbi:unnamed protein product [Ectocarpus sp. 8 AP-2014]
MSHVTLGERVYMKDTDMFGDVERTTVLGVEAVSLVDDEGTTKAFFGARKESAIVKKDTGEDGAGVTVDVPTDVREEGADVLTAMNIAPEDQSLKFAKFMGMFDQATRRAYMDEWVAKKDDATQREAFLQGLLGALDDDETFIKTQGEQALSGVDPRVRQYMFERLLTTLDKTERESLILEWMAVKHSPDKKEEFLQGMYELLMDDDDYIAMEGRKAFTRLRILADDQAEIFTQFMTTVSAEDRAKYTSEYRKVRTSASKKKSLLNDLINLSKEGA